jgi:hypothetical protein
MSVEEIVLSIPKDRRVTVLLQTHEIASTNEFRHLIECQDQIYAGLVIFLAVQRAE